MPFCAYYNTPPRTMQAKRPRGQRAVGMPSRGRRFFVLGAVSFEQFRFSESRNLWLIRRVSLFLLPQDWYNIPKIGSEKREKMKRRTKHRSNAFTHLYVPPTGSAHAHPPLCPATMPLFPQPSPDACVSFMGVLRHKGDFLFSGRWGLCTACFPCPPDSERWQRRTPARAMHRGLCPQATRAQTPLPYRADGSQGRQRTPSQTVCKNLSPQAAQAQAPILPCRQCPGKRRGAVANFFCFFAHFFFNPDKTCPGYLLNWS